MTTFHPDNLLQAIKKTLHEQADPKQAPEMQRYMKSEMLFYGVKTPVRRKACRKIFTDFEPWDFKKWTDCVLFIWRNAEFREERYSAIDLITWKPCVDFQTWDALPMLEELIVTGAWWDYCDNLAGPLGNILRAEPARMSELMQEWAVDENLWKRRSSILCQLRFKDELDFDLLKKCIAPNVTSKEFFLRKAIGWALRDYAWTNPQTINDFVKENDCSLSPLTKREALKNMPKLLDS